jgi:hypothetical protein
MFSCRDHDKAGVRRLGRAVEYGEEDLVELSVRSKARGNGFLHRRRAGARVIRE